jgi:hypothetical protein
MATLDEVRRSYQLTPSNNTMVGIGQQLKEQGSMNSVTLTNFKSKFHQNVISNRLGDN